MGESQDEYTIIEDREEPLRVAPRCSVVKISCGVVPSFKDVRSDDDSHVRGDPYTMGRLDSAYSDAMSVLNSLFDIDLMDPEQEALIVSIRSQMAHYRLLIDRFSDDDGDE